MTVSRTLSSCVVSALLVACAPEDRAGAPDTTAAATTTAAAPSQAAPAAPATTDEQKIAEAMSAAPDSIARNAAIMDWPQTEGGEFRQLRAGTNDWACFPTMPNVPASAGRAPMCLDPVFQEWGAAHAAKRAPRTSSVGLAYMLRGDAGASNTDPFAMDSTADNNWVRVGPHVMIVAPVSTLAALSDRPGPGPWVMWKGTPYAHIMMPVP